MKNPTNTFFVSSANWELAVDHTNHEDAAVSAIIMALKKFGENLLMSTVIMVCDEEAQISNDITKAEFFATHEIFKKIGLNSLSHSFQEYCELQNES